MNMFAAKIAVIALAIVMLATLVYGFTQGNGWDEVRILVEYPWFNVSLVDVYVGFLMFCGWVLYRERSKSIAAVWILAILILGNLIACIYALSALMLARNCWKRFWLGVHAE